MRKKYECLFLRKQKNFSEAKNASSNLMSLIP
jgi:hypothetical protein